jgi:hypothetical protein
MEDAVVKKALADEGFRNRLRTNARAAVDQVLGELAPNARLPQSLQVRAIEESPDTFSIVIPHVRTQPELSDAELEQVAGGILVIAWF